jgi:multiple sugar transport system substrate-binding protein
MKRNQNRLLPRVSLCLALAVLLPAFTFAAGKQESKKAEDRPIVYEGWLRSWEGVSLVLSTHQGPNTDAYKEMAKEFERITGAKVTILDESWTDLLSKHLASYAAHDGAYDLVTFFYGWFGHYVEGGLLQDLNRWFERKLIADPAYAMEDFIPAVLEVYGRYKAGFFKDPNALWAVPYKFDVYTAQYRADLFEQAGIVGKDGKARPPATWDELLADAKILARKFPNITPVVLPLAVDDPTVSTFLPIITSYGANKPNPWYDANLYPQFHKEPGVRAARLLKDLMPFMPADVLNYDYDKVNTLMAQGMAAYALNWNAYLPVLLDPSKSKITDSVRFDNTPGGVGGRPQGLGGWSIGLSSDSKNPEAAFQLLQFLTGKKTAVSLALKGGSVARSSAVSDPQVIARFPYYPLLVEGAKDAVARGSDRSWTEIQRIIGVELSNILLGAEERQGLLETARKVFDAAKQAGYNPEKSGPRP